MVLTERHESKIRVEADFQTKDRILTLPGARWDRVNGVCTLPLSYASCKQLRAILGDDLEIGPELYAWAVAEMENRVEPCLQLRQSLEPTHPDTWDERLYSYQKAGAEFLVKAQHALLSDCVGSGKTMTAIAAAKRANALPALIVCPNSTKLQWLKAIEEWWGVPVNIVEGTKKQRIERILDSEKGVCVIHWEALRLYSRLAPYGSMRLSEEERTPKELNQIPWQLVILDEGHKIASAVSKQTRAAWAIGHQPSVQYRWALTATPLTNKPDSLYPVLHYLDPKEWPSKTAYIQRYCDSAPSFWGPGLDIFGLNEERKEEFFSIFDPRFRRMPKEVILPFLPPVQRIRRDLDMGPEQARGYRTMVEDMVSTDENDELIIAVNPVSKLTRSIQYASSCLTVNELGQPRMTGPSCKIDQLMLDLEDYLTSGESVIVFAVHRQLIEMAEAKLQEKGTPYSVIKGNQKAGERQRNIDDFQEEGKVQVILAVIAAGGVGLNLQKARIAIFLQRPMSNVDYQQALGRNNRIGSEVYNSLLVVDYVTRGTIESYQLRLLEGKAQQLEAVVRDRETIKRLLNGDDE